MTTSTRTRPSPIPRRTTGQNRTEREYATRLEVLRRSGELLSWEFEAVKLRIGPPRSRCWYSPDFLVVTEKEIQLHEVKGTYCRDDARVKLLSAAREYPCFRFYLCVKSREGWKVSEV